MSIDRQKLVLMIDGDALVIGSLRHSLPGRAVHEHDAVLNSIVNFHAKACTIVSTAYKSPAPKRLVADWPRRPLLSKSESLFYLSELVARLGERLGFDV